MCYDISFTSKIKKIAEYLPGINKKLVEELDSVFTPIAHQIGQSFATWPTIIAEKNDLLIKPLEWGLIAPYMNTAASIKKHRPLMLNARSEKLLDSASFWYKIRQNRCLIPVTGFYEHRAIKGLKNKVPYFISRTNQDIMFLAGLYHYSPLPHPETGAAVGTFTILTQPANELLAAIHNSGEHSSRMPLQFPNGMAEQWLNPSLSDSEIQSMIPFSFPSDALRASPVYTIRGAKTRPDGKAKFEEYPYKGLPDIFEAALIKPANSLLF